MVDIYHGKFVQEGPPELYSTGILSYSSQNTPRKLFCCGRKNAGAHMQCGSCPER